MGAGGGSRAAAIARPFLAELVSVSPAPAPAPAPAPSPTPVPSGLGLASLGSSGTHRPKLRHPRGRLERGEREGAEEHGEDVQVGRQQSFQHVQVQQVYRKHYF